MPWSILNAQGWSILVAPQQSKADLRSGCDEVMQGFIHMLSHLEKVEEAMLDDLAQKGAAIELLRRNGLPAEEANFRLMPGEPFHHEARAEQPPP